MHQHKYDEYLSSQQILFFKDITKLDVVCDFITLNKCKVKL
jgi:hypothetical protein